MATHAIHLKNRKNLSQISYMLMAAGLGAGFMFFLDATFLKASDIKISDLRAEIQRLESNNTGLESQVRDLSVRNQDLQGFVDNLKQEKSLLSEKLAASEIDFANKQAELDNVFASKSKIESEAKILSACVLDSQNLTASSKGFVTLYRSEGLRTALAREGLPVATSLMSFHDSWSTGNCVDASNLATEYRAQ